MLGKVSLQGRELSLDNNVHEHLISEKLDDVELVTNPFRAPFHHLASLSGALDAVLH